MERRGDTDAIVETLKTGPTAGVTATGVVAARGGRIGIDHHVGNMTRGKGGRRKEMTGEGGTTILLPEIRDGTQSVVTGDHIAIAAAVLSVETGEGVEAEMIADKKQQTGGEA